MKKTHAWIVLFALMPFVMGAGFLEFDEDGTPYAWNTGSAQDIVISFDSNGGADVGTVDFDTAVEVFMTSTSNPVIDYYNDVTGSALSIANNNIESSVLTATSDLTAGSVGVLVNSITGFVQQSAASDCLIKADANSANANLAVYIDSDGSWFASVGLSSQVLGLASPTLYDEAGNITCASMFVNGPAVNSLSDLRYIMAHELGHALNLVHSQINGGLITSEPEKTPLMYPLIPGDTTQALAQPLKLDDVFSFSYLYATDTLNASNRIEGTVTNRFGQGVLATNVICRNTNTIEDSVSWISGATLDDDGAFTCGLLPDGTYEVEVSPIFTAINEWEDNPPFIPTEFYSGVDEDFDPAVDELSSKQGVIVGSGNLIEDIDIILNEDGRLRKGTALIDTVSAGSINTSDSSIVPQIHSLPFFVYIPENASEATFTLTADNPDQDIDLLIRACSPYSLSSATVGPPFNQASPNSDQTDYASISTSGTESITINSSSSPSLDACEYHIIVPNFSTSDAGFTIEVDFDGNTPDAVFDFDSRNVEQPNGQTLVSELTAFARGDQFIIEAIEFTDTGTVGNDNATAAYMYEDINDNGEVDDEDTLIASTTGIGQDQFTLENMNLYLQDDTRRTFLFTYDLIASSRMPIWALLLLLSLMLGMAIHPKSRMLGLCILMLSSNLACSGGGDSDFNLGIESEASITGEALGFGDDFNLQSDSVQSVEDFFAD